MQPCKLSEAQSVPESKSVHPAAACMSCTHLGSFGALRHRNTLSVLLCMVSDKIQEKDECYAAFLFIIYSLIFDVVDVVLYLCWDSL